MHKCSSSKLPTIQVLRHKLFPEQEKHDFTQTRKHEKTSLASPGALTHRLQRAGEKKMERQITVKIVTTNVVASRPPNGDRLQCRSLVPI